MFGWIWNKVFGGGGSTTTEETAKAAAVPAEEENHSNDRKRTHDANDTSTNQKETKVAASPRKRTRTATASSPGTKKAITTTKTKSPTKPTSTKKAAATTTTTATTTTATTKSPASRSLPKVIHQEEKVRTPRPRQTFEAMVEQLKAFKAQHGHVRVPVKCENKPLSRFVRNIRAKHAKSEGATLPPHQLKQLMDIGFEWKVPRGRKPKK